VAFILLIVFQKVKMGSITGTAVNAVPTAQARRNSKQCL